MHHRIGAAASTLTGWLEGPCPARPAGPARAAGLTGSAPSSATQGWPRYGSTVVRLVWAPVDAIADIVGARARWDGLRLSGAALVPMPDDNGWAATGRLRVSWTSTPVSVELRILPAPGDRAWIHLVLTSRGRFPRLYWSNGHDALAVIDHTAYPLPRWPYR
jgi:hypothetical protein